MLNFRYLYDLLDLVDTLKMRVNTIQENVTLSRTRIVTQIAIKKQRDEIRKLGSTEVIDLDANTNIIDLN